jgi:hypothetical protein
MISARVCGFSLALGFTIGLGGFGLVGCGDPGSSSSCQPGSQLCQCLNGQCMFGLTCVNGFCFGDNGETSGDGDGDPGDGDPGDGDPGDGDPGDGDPGDGDPGDGDPGDGDGDPGDGDPGDGDPGDGDGDACVPEQYAASYEPPAVMLVVDASGSMVAFTWDHDVNPNTVNVTRWSSLRNVVQTIVNTYDDRFLAGIQRFPSAAACDPNPCYNITACTTEATPEADIALNNAASILASIPAANATSTEIEGATPTTLGLESAINHLNQAAGDSPRYIVLVTDGAANCNTNLPFPDVIESYDETLPFVVEDAYQLDGIPTFVVGIGIVNMTVGAGADGSPEANPWVRLNDVAIAGGTALGGAEKFYNADNQNELSSALDGIFSSLMACEIDLGTLPDGPPTPMQEPYVDLESNGQTIPYVNSCADQNGWTWIEAGAVAELCGTYCDQFASDAASITVVYGCP